jgi:hypothetical protein
MAGLIDALVERGKRRARKGKGRGRILAVAGLATLASLLRSHPGATLRALGRGAAAGAREGVAVLRERPPRPPTRTGAAVPRRLRKALGRLRRDLRIGDKD